MVIFVPAVNIYRQNLHDIDPGTGVNVAGRLRALSSAFQNLSAMSLQSLFENAEETFEKRQGSMLEITASTMVLHPSTIPFLGLNIVEYFFDQLIPRIFWPAKPVERDPLFMITSIYYGASEEYTFSSIGLFADSYRIGGWPFLIIWFALCGIFSAWLYRAGPGGGYVPNVVFYIVLLQGILYYDTEVSTVLLRLVHFVPFIFLLIKYVLFEPQKNY